jgi:MinD superfamily P-loop ATPase
VAIASGKGGTGKTTVALNLALSLGGQVQLLDCDVEEPNCALYLRPRIDSRTTVGISVPRVDETVCNACGECGKVCQYHAIVSLTTTPLVFPELCHGCGGCTLVCPTGAIREEMRPIGAIERGTRGTLSFAHGLLNVGEAKPVPLIRALRQEARPDGIVLLDAPPGTSCPVIATIRGSDYVILVTEPTPFGLNDLALAVQAVRVVGAPFGVVINRWGSGDDSVRRFCAGEGIPVLQEIPDDMRVARACSRGEIAVEALPHVRPLFAALAARVLALQEELQSAALPAGRIP